VTRKRGGEKTGDRRNYKKTVSVSLLLSISLGYLVLREMDLEETKKILLDWRWEYTPLLLSLAALKNLVRGLRLYAMHPRGASRRAYFCAISAQNFFFLALPAVLGEVSLVYILRRVLKVDLRQSMTNVAIVRLFDIAVYVLFSSIIIAVTWGDESRMLLTGMFFLAAALVTILAAFHFLSRHEWPASPGRGFSHFAERQLKLFKASVLTVSNRAVLVQVAAYTVVNYVLNLSIFVLVLRSFSADFPLLNGIILNIFTTPIFLLPVKGIGNFGTHEAAYFYGLQLLDVSKLHAIGIALGTHAIDLGLGLVMTLVGLAGLLALSEKQRPQAG
jgi:hypothetical protein